MLMGSNFPSPNPHLTDAMNSQSHHSNMLSDAPKCVRCSQSIYDPTLVSFGEKFWHRACFRCMMCQKELDDACFSNGKELYCTEDFTRLYRSHCAGCSEDLTPSEIVRRIFGSVYHETCFKCTLCDRSLQTGDRVYLRDDNKLICEEDYAHLHGEDERDSHLHQDNSEIPMTEQQTAVLNGVYIGDPAPSLTKCRIMSAETGLRINTIQSWFREKRCRDKRLMEQNGKLAYDPAAREFFTWLEKAFSPSCIPPNVELTPDAIRDGEVLLPNVSHTASVTYPCFPGRSHRHWVPCNTS